MTLHNRYSLTRAVQSSVSAALRTDVLLQCTEYVLDPKTFAPRAAFWATIHNKPPQVVPEVVFTPTDLDNEDIVEQLTTALVAYLKEQ